jgi:hypothetical protein
MMVYHRGKYGAFKVSSTLHCPKTMKNSCILTLLVDSFRQFDQNQYVVNYFYFCETQSKRSVEVYKGKKLDPPVITNLVS